MNNIPDFLKRTASKSGFVRTKFVEKDIPDDHKKLAVMFFFGDTRSIFTLSSLLLHRYQEEMKGSKYFILCTWPGFEGLFPYVDEYWGFKDKELAKTLSKTAMGLDNDSEGAITCERNLRLHFEDVSNSETLRPYYENGIQQEFWERFRHVKRFLPLIPSSSVLGEAFDRQVAAERSVVIHPVLQINRWRQGHLEGLRVPEEFWISLCETLREHGITPVVYQNFDTHNLAAVMDGLFVDNVPVSNLLGAMRRVGCVLDVFSGISHFAIAARCPFVACDERTRFHEFRQDEIDGLCCEKSLPREYIFAFPTIITDGNPQLWRASLFSLLLAKLEPFMESLNRETWPPTSESTKIVPYQEVKRKRMKKIGVRFIKVEGQHGH